MATAYTKQECRDKAVSVLKMLANTREPMHGAIYQWAARFMVMSFEHWRK